MMLWPFLFISNPSVVAGGGRNFTVLVLHNSKYWLRCVAGQKGQICKSTNEKRLLFPIMLLMDVIVFL